MSVGAAICQQSETTYIVQKKKTQSQYKKIS